MKKLKNSPWFYLGWAFNLFVLMRVQSKMHLFMAEYNPDKLGALHAGMMLLWLFAGFLIFLSDMKMKEDRDMNVKILISSALTFFIIDGIAISSAIADMLRNVFH